VGSGGAQINKIRDSLGVAIHFDQEPESVKESSRKKKERFPYKSRVKVCTRSFSRGMLVDATATDCWS